MLPSRSSAQITGQHAVKTKATKSIATFNILEGQEIGARVTLRGATTWEFLDRLMNVAFPLSRTSGE